MPKRSRTIWIVVILGAGLAAVLWFVTQPRHRAPEAPRLESPIAGAKLPTRWSRCTNEVYGYEVRFPLGWYTQQLSPDQACPWFDPERFELVSGTEGPSTARVVFPSPEKFNEALKGIMHPVVARALLRDDLSIRGRRAVGLETEATGTGPEPDGTLLYGCILDLGEGGALIIETTSLGTSDYTSNKAIVDQVVQMLRFTK